MNDHDVDKKIEILNRLIDELERKRGFNGIVRKCIQKTNVLVGIMVTILITSMIVYAAQIVFVDGEIISANDVNTNFTELYNGVAGLETDVTGIDNRVDDLETDVTNIDSRVGDLETNPRNYCYASTYSGISTSSSTWTNVTDLSNCTITTTGNPLKVMMDFYIRVFAYDDVGGIRLVDGTDIYGGDDECGFQPLAYDEPIYYRKINIVRILEGVPAGTHNFMAQVRVTGNSLQILGGNEEDQYIGFHLFIEEL